MHEWLSECSIFIWISWSCLQRVRYVHQFVFVEGWGLLSQFPPFRHFPHFQHCQNTCLLLNILFMFNRCGRSSAAMAPVKYNCNLNNLRGTFTRSKILLTEKLTNGALVTPTPDWRLTFCKRWWQYHYVQDLDVYYRWSKLEVDQNCILVAETSQFVQDWKPNYCVNIIRTFGNRCLSAIGGGNRWSRFAGWVQLSAEAAWPPRNTTSATLCAQVTMRLIFGLQYDFLNHNDVMIIGTYFFLRKGTRKTTTDTKMG